MSRYNKPGRVSFYSSQCLSTNKPYSNISPLLPAHSATGKNMPITDGSEGFMLVTSIAFAAAGAANIVIVVSEGECLVSVNKTIEDGHPSTALQIFLLFASQLKT